VVERRSDVEVSRIEHSAVKHRGGRSGDDVFDLVLVEDLEQRFDIRLLPFHSTHLFLAHPSGPDPRALQSQRASRERGFRNVP
jgi:hypothetical protein